MLIQLLIHCGAKIQVRSPNFSVGKLVTIVVPMSENNMHGSLRSVGWPPASACACIIDSSYGSVEEKTYVYRC